MAPVRRRLYIAVGFGEIHFGCRVSACALGTVDCRDRSEPRRNGQHTRHQRTRRYGLANPRCDTRPSLL